MVGSAAGMACKQERPHRSSFSELPEGWLFPISCPSCPQIGAWVPTGSGQESLLFRHERINNLRTPQTNFRCLFVKLGMDGTVPRRLAVSAALSAVAGGQSDYRIRTVTSGRNFHKWDLGRVLTLSRTLGSCPCDQKSADQSEPCGVDPHLATRWGQRCKTLGIPSVFLLN